jgi:hypothetical protein
MRNFAQSGRPVAAQDFLKFGTRHKLDTLDFCDEMTSFVPAKKLTLRKKTADRFDGKFTGFVYPFSSHAHLLNRASCQGDQMRLGKSRQKCSPIHFLAKLIHNFYSRKSSQIM